MLKIYNISLDNWITNGHKMHTPKNSYYPKHTLHDILISYGLFNDAVRSSGYIALNGRMMKNNKFE
jgi:hypothetical protein